MTGHAPMGDSSTLSYEYRAIVKDADGETDYEGPFESYEDAATVLPALMAGEPPWDEGWIERRVPSDWERTDA